MQTVPPKPDWQPQGPLDTWAAQWATDSLKLSRTQAYRSVRIVRERTIPVLRNGAPLIRDGQPVTQTVYDITRPSDYQAVVSAINSGKPVVTASPRSKFARNLRQLADMLTAAGPGPKGGAPASKRSTSLLGMVWNPKSLPGA